MNRVLKFRVWNTNQKKFLESDQIGISGIGTILTYDWHDDNGKSWNTDCWNGNNLYVVQQFTGLLDYEGKEIYEGDILEELVNNETLKNIGVCQQVLGGWKTFSHPNSSICFHGWKQKIIGNIFENPNLLA